MAEAEEDVIRVLYDYSYTDDSGQVTIHAGDVYRLVERTNNEWWQVYDPSDSSCDSFFVPAQYVEVVSDKSPLKTLSDLDKLLTFGETGQSRTGSHYDESGCEQVPGQESDYANAIPSHHNQLQDEGEGEYVNLDSFRDASGLKPIVSKKNVFILFET